MIGIHVQALVFFTFIVVLSYLFTVSKQWYCRKGFVFNQKGEVNAFQHFSTECCSYI